MTEIKSGGYISNILRPERSRKRKDIHMEVKGLLGYGLFEENSFIITDGGESAVVDPCFAYDDVLPKELKIKYVLLTHGHIDHIASAAKTAEIFGAKIVSCKEEARLLEDPQLNLTRSHGHEISIKPDILLEDGEELTLGNVKIKLMHTPGHTGGSCCFIIEDCIFTGDTVMAGTIGRTDLPTASDSQMSNSINRLRSLKGNYILHCGHGKDTTLERECSLNPYFQG